jgi:hypothetical protein
MACRSVGADLFVQVRGQWCPGRPPGRVHVVLQQIRPPTTPKECLTTRAWIHPPMPQIVRSPRWAQLAVPGRGPVRRRSTGSG